MEVRVTRAADDRVTVAMRLTGSRNELLALARHIEVRRADVSTGSVAAPTDEVDALGKLVAGIQIAVR